MLVCSCESCANNAGGVLSPSHRAFSCIRSYDMQVNKRFYGLNIIPYRTFRIVIVYILQMHGFSNVRVLDSDSRNEVIYTQLLPDLWNPAACGVCVWLYARKQQWKSNTRTPTTHICGHACMSDLGRYRSLSASWLGSYTILTLLIPAKIMWWRLSRKVEREGSRVGWQVMMYMMLVHCAWCGDGCVAFTTHTHTHIHINRLDVVPCANVFHLLDKYVRA